MVTYITVLYPQYCSSSSSLTLPYQVNTSFHTLLSRQTVRPGGEEGRRVKSHSLFFLTRSDRAPTPGSTWPGVGSDESGVFQHPPPPSLPPPFPPWDIDLGISVALPGNSLRQLVSPRRGEGYEVVWRIILRFNTI